MALMSNLESWQRYVPFPLQLEIFYLDDNGTQKKKKKKKLC